MKRSNGRLLFNSKCPIILKTVDIPTPKSQVYVTTQAHYKILCVNDTKEKKNPSVVAKVTQVGDVAHGPLVEVWTIPGVHRADSYRTQLVPSVLGAVVFRRERAYLLVSSISISFQIRGLDVRAFGHDSAQEQ
jgi:hypothetical protein